MRYIRCAIVVVRWDGMDGKLYCGGTCNTIIVLSKTIGTTYADKALPASLAVAKAVRGV